LEHNSVDTSIDRREQNKGSINKTRRQKDNQALRTSHSGIRA